MMRKWHSKLFEDKLWGDKFWTSGYFYRTVGAVNAETVKKYIQEGQLTDWAKEQLAKARKEPESSYTDLDDI